MGRFLTPDWSASPAFVPYANLSNPQTFNLYSYATNNPTSHADINGHLDSQHQEEATIGPAPSAGNVAGSFFHHLFHGEFWLLDDPGYSVRTRDTVNWAMPRLTPRIPPMLSSPSGS